MLHNITNIEVGAVMPKGASGRVVIEVDPHLKRRLYSVLAMDGSTLKEWFISAADSFISEREQPTLPEINDKKKAGRRS